MISMSRIGVAAALLTVLAGGCSSSGGAATADGAPAPTPAIDQLPPDAAALGMSYACTGYFVGADGGEVDGADAGSPKTCVAGQTYCSVTRPHPDYAGAATASCVAVPASCAQAPTCACLCATDPLTCAINCRCSEKDGLATITCDEI